jgi:hypothetical protein
MTILIADADFSGVNAGRNSRHRPHRAWLRNPPVKRIEALPHTSICREAGPVPRLQLAEAEDDHLAVGCLGVPDAACCSLCEELFLGRRKALSGQNGPDLRSIAERCHVQVYGAASRARATA